METWKYIIGSNEKYKISNKGNIISYSKCKLGVKLSGTLRKEGYIVVLLTMDGKLQSTRINRLVASHFIENPNNYNIVDHIDGNRCNNRVENLRWVSANQNSINSQVSSLNTSGIKGVSFINGKNKPWRASWVQNGKYTHRHFTTQDEASNYRLKMIDEIYGVQFNTDRHTKQVKIRIQNKFTDDEYKEEQWKTFEGSNNKYEISNLGRVKSFCKSDKGIILKLNKTSSNYLSVNISINEKYKSYIIHRLVAQHFIPNTNNYMYVDHINNNRQDNRVINLRWISIELNSLNRPTPSNNKTGIKGVCYIQNSNLPWKAHWRENGKAYKKCYKGFAKRWKNKWKNKFYF